KSNVTPQDAQKIYDARWRAKNKAKLNRKERIRDKTPSGAFQKARKKAKWRKQGWEVSFKKWWQMWEEAPEFEDPDRPGVFT
ncbi:hypothetical protein DF186_21915, partial [Enterococcus hirae]